MKRIDVPLVAAIAAGVLLLVIGVGSVFVAPSGVERVDPGRRPGDVGVARPVPAPAEPLPDPGAAPPDELAAMDDQLRALEEQDAALRDELAATAAASDDPATDLRVQRLYEQRRGTLGGMAALREEMASLGLGPSMDEEAHEATEPRDQELADTLVTFATRPETASDAPPFADEVRLGLGWNLLATRTADELADPTAWSIDDEGTHFRGGSGPFDLLTATARLAEHGYEVTVGPHSRCAGGPHPAPIELEGLRRVSLQARTGDAGCLQWSSTEMYVDGDGRIHAIVLDLWEP